MLSRHSVEIYQGALSSLSHREVTLAQRVELVFFVYAQAGNNLLTTPTPPPPHK